MPIYEYECDECGEFFEAFLSIKKDNKTHICKKCGKLSHKIMSKNTFHLKGQGWSADGYIGKYDKFDDAMKCEF